MYKTSLTLRKNLIEWLFEKSQTVYTSMFKKHKPWGVYKIDLLQYPKHSLGKKLGDFLHKNNFELISKVERHDAYHVLTGFGVRVQDEIALQCLCLGNGKRSIYLLGAVILGILILPDYLPNYIQSYRIGKQANTFHCFDFKKLLNQPLDRLRSAIFTAKEFEKLIHLQNENHQIKNNTRNFTINTILPTPADG